MSERTCAGCSQPLYRTHRAVWSCATPRCWGNLPERMPGADWNPLESDKTAPRSDERVRDDQPPAPDGGEAASEGAL